MPGPSRSFDRIKIAAPCDADWDAMIGNERVRFCEHCNHHVTNLSALTRPEAMRLVERSQGRLCVRFAMNPNGRVLTKQLPQKVHQIARRASRIAAGAFSATLSLSSAAVQAQSGNSSEPPRETPVVATAVLTRAPEAELTGKVRHINGDPVVGANVILTRKGTGAAFVAVAGPDGLYNFSLLEEGEYTLQADAPSFAPSEIVEVQLSAASKNFRHLVLGVAQLVIEPQTLSSLVSSRRHVIMGMVSVSQPEDPLIKAAFDDDLTRLVELISTKIDLDASDKATHTSALAYAIRNNNLEMVQVLLSAGASPNSVNNEGQTPLMFLDSEATVEFVRRLIGLGVDVRARDNSGGSVLMNIARSGNFSVVKELIAAGAKIDARDNDGNTVVMSAAANEDAELLEFLIKAGAPLNHKNNHGLSAASVAARAGHGKSLKVLIDAGATIDLDETELKDALLVAARGEDTSTVKILLKLGAKATAKDEGDMTVLMLAADNGDAEMVKALIDEGADVNAVDNEGWTALMHANEAENVRVLLNAGANIGVRNKDGETTLTLALRYEQEEIVKLLRSRGAPE